VYHEQSISRNETVIRSIPVPSRIRAEAWDVTGRGREGTKGETGMISLIPLFIVSGLVGGLMIVVGVNYGDVMGQWLSIFGMISVGVSAYAIIGCLPKYPYSQEE
jgi:hypothetical protein